MTTTATSNETSLWLRASPNGKRTGFVVLGDGVGGTITVTILPKAWAVRAKAARYHRHEPGTTSHLTAYETDYVCVSGPERALGTVALNISKLSGPGQAELVASTRPPAERATASAGEANFFNDLLDLMLLADRGGINLADTPYDGEFALTLMRLLMQERLVQAVELVLFRVRPRYVEHREALAIPRGRLNDEGLLLASVTGHPTIDCTYDELTTDTPLLRVILAALRVVATDRLPARVAALRPRIQARARDLIRHLATVQAIDRDSANILADRLWLGPLDRPWQPALDAAKPVLREVGLVPEEGSHATDAAAVHVFTERVWEQAVDAILRTTFGGVRASADGSPGAGVVAPQPWTAGHQSVQSESYPDFMFMVGPRAVLADAKYKLNSTLSSADGYQLFAYSHLARLDGALSIIGLLVYPVRSPGGADQLMRVRLPDRAYPLWSVRLPFPTRNDVRSWTAWAQYISRQSAALSDLSQDWTSKHVAPVLVDEILGHGA